MADLTPTSSAWQFTGPLNSIGTNSSAMGALAQAGAVGIGAAVGASQTAAGNQAAYNSVQTGLSTSAAALNPYVTAGQGAATQLQNLYGFNGATAETNAQNAFTNTPGYQFQVKQGDAAINRQASASGGGFSTTALGALDQYNSGLANSTYQAYVSNLYNLMGTGENAGVARGSQAITGENAAGGFQVGKGQANSSGVLGAAGSIGALLGNPTVQSGIQNLFGSGSGMLPNSSWGTTNGNISSGYTNPSIYGNGIDTSSAIQDVGLPEIPAYDSLGDF